MTKGGQEAKLYFMGHAVMENRHAADTQPHCVDRMRKPSKGLLTPRRCYLSYLFQNKYLVGAHPARPVPPRTD